MKLTLVNRICSTRVSRVQFGVPPNCGGGRGQTFCITHHQNSYVSPVSGGTPETTRQRRVLPTANGSFRQI